MQRRLKAASVMKILDITSRETLRKLVRLNLLAPPFQDYEGGPNYWVEEDVEQCIKAQAERRNWRGQKREAAPA